MTAPQPSWGRYAELRPDHLTAIRAATPAIFLPLGALEWHGPHMPLGSDGILAEAIAERVVRRTGGVLLPTAWWPSSVIPHGTSLALSAATARVVCDSTFDSLAAAGWRVVVTLNGHTTPGFELMLMDAAEAAMRRHKIIALSLPPLALVDEEMLDHGALWESSLLLALRPDLVSLDALGAGPLDVGTSAVVGRDPRGSATASLGNRALGLAVERVVVAVNQLLRDGRPDPVRALYQHRRERYRSYRERYGSRPSEAAAAEWWHDLVEEKKS